MSDSLKQMIESENYEKMFAHLDHITPEQAQEFIDSGEETRIFVGRITCSYCRKQIKNVLKIVDEHNVNIYHINTDDANYAETTQTFRAEHNIPTVPGLIYAKDGEVKVRTDSSMSIEEIEELLAL